MSCLGLGNTAVSAACLKVDAGQPLAVPSTKKSSQDETLGHSPLVRLLLTNFRCMHAMYGTRSPRRVGHRVVVALSGCSAFSGG